VSERPRRHRRASRADWQSAHAAASAQLAGIDAELESLLRRRRACLDDLDGLRTRLNRRWTHHHVRRHARVDEPPMAPAPPGAEELHGTDLRAVCTTLLRRHGPLPLRQLHCLLHQYGYVVGGARPVQRLGDAMAYEVACGRAERVERGVYAATGTPPPRPSWAGRAPEPSSPLPWSRPETEPGPPLVDPPVALDPEHWSGGAWPGEVPGGPDGTVDAAVDASAEPNGAAESTAAGATSSSALRRQSAADLATGSGSAPADAPGPPEESGPLPKHVGDDSPANRPRVPAVDMTGRSGDGGGEGRAGRADGGP
jgi:hypothetical protein